jgi:dephospho-CoA kinase
MIIGICGLIGSGKGTAADILVDEHGFVTDEPNSFVRVIQ